MTEREVIQALRKKLREYLLSQGVKVQNSFISCLSPTHADKNPSCSLGGEHGDEVFHCFSCDFAGNIFTAAYLLEGKPISGPMFYKETIPYLAEQFGLEYEREEASEEDRRRMMMLSAYHDAHNIISVNIRSTEENHPGVVKIRNRGWSIDTAAELGIGSIRSRKDYLKKMESRGWDQKYLESVGLTDTNIFQPENLIFSLKDGYGQVVAFTARRPEPAKPKFKNSHNSEIFRKREHLFLEHVWSRKGMLAGPLFVFEGHPDAVTSYQAGLKKCTCLGSSSVSEEQLSVLKEKGIRDVVLCMDADEAGTQATERMLVKHWLDPKWNFVVRIMELPEGTDPDDYIRDMGIEKFHALPKITPFEWKLSREVDDYSADPVDVAKSYVPVILAEEDRIERERQIRILSAKTGIQEITLRDELERVTLQNSVQKRERIQRVTDSLLDSLRKGGDIRVVCETAISSVSQIEEEFSRKEGNQEDEFLKGVERIRKRLSEKSDSRRARLGQTLSITQDKLEGGFAREAQLYVIGGKPSMGKTSFLRHLAWAMCVNNPDLSVMYINIDDSLQKSLPAMVALVANTLIKDIHSTWRLGPADRALVEEAWDKVRTMAESGRLIMKDSSGGTDIFSLEDHIRTFQKQHPGCDLVVIFDNFHNLTNEGESDENRKDTFHGNRMKDLCLKYDVPIITTAELRKAQTVASIGRQKNIDEVAGSRTLSFRCDVLALLSQEYYFNRETPMVWMSQGKSTRVPDPTKQLSSAARVKPIVELEIVKNKDVGGWKGVLYYAFDPDKNWFKEIPSKIIGDVKIKARQAKRSNGGKGA